MAKTDFKSVREYLASQPRGAQAPLKRVRSTIRKAVPEAEVVPLKELASRLIELSKEDAKVKAGRRTMV